MKFLHASGLVLLLSFGVAVFAHADDAPAIAPAQSLTAVRDGVTGRLRAPDDQELAALSGRVAPDGPVSSKAARKAAMQAASSTVRTLPNGAHTARLPAVLASFVIVKRRPDGSLDSKCVDGQQAATDELADTGSATQSGGASPPAPQAQ